MQQVTVTDGFWQTCCCRRAQGWTGGRGPGHLSFVFPTARPPCLCWPAGEGLGSLCSITFTGVRYASEPAAKKAVRFLEHPLSQNFMVLKSQISTWFHLNTKMSHL